MELNNMDILSDEICDVVERVFKDKIDGIVIYDMIDESNHHTFKLKFRVYNFAGVKFQYENDFFEIYVFSMVTRVYCCLRKIVVTVK